MRWKNWKSAAKQAATKRAHAAYCLVLAEESPSEQAGAHAAGQMDRFAAEYGNFRGALEWLTDTGDAEWGLRLGAALFRFWETREYLTEGRARLGKLLKLPRAAAPTKFRARALFAAGVLAGAQGDYAAADELIRESMEIARQLDDGQGVAVSLNALAVLAQDRGDIAAAHVLFEESLEVWRELGDSRDVARALSNLANVTTMQGDHERAKSLYGECLAIFQGLGDRTGVAWSLNSQGDVAHDRGDAAGGAGILRTGAGDFSGTRRPLGNCRHAGGPGQHGAGRAGLFRGARALPGKFETFPGIGAQTRHCAIAGVFRVRRGSSISFRPGAAAGGRGGGTATENWRSPDARGKRQAREQSEKHAARIRRDFQLLRLGRRAGELPLDRAIEEALLREAASPAS